MGDAWGTAATAAGDGGDGAAQLHRPRRLLGFGAACGMALRDAVAAVFFFVVITVVPFSLAAAGTLAVVALAKAAHRLLRGGPPGGGGLPDKEIEAIPVCVYAAAPPGGRRRGEEGQGLRRVLGGLRGGGAASPSGLWALLPPGLHRPVAPPRATCPKCSAWSPWR
ncbi:unnamed protein product [Spirodela intermedia]|uniref:Uncharacterized protein n=1 Tax=Spirodela intermedia TaxID=51605 RepID=A0ABN7ECF4_SPIIN|nr:unnamed protein product [Spirodela intermedia]